MLVKCFFARPNSLPVSLESTTEAPSPEFSSSATNYSAIFPAKVKDYFPKMASTTISKGLCVVVGAGDGLGKALCLRFAKAGFVS